MLLRVNISINRQTSAHLKPSDVYSARTLSHPSCLFVFEVKLSYQHSRHPTALKDVNNKTRLSMKDLQRWSRTLPGRNISFE